MSPSPSLCMTHVLFSGHAEGKYRTHGMCPVNKTHSVHMCPHVSCSTRRIRDTGGGGGLDVSGDLYIYNIYIYIYIYIYI
jgi:hypothetical protein